MPSVSDGLKWTTQVPDFKGDAEKFISKHEKENKMEEGFTIEPDDCLGEGTWLVIISFCNPYFQRLNN